MSNLYSEVLFLWHFSLHTMGNGVAMRDPACYSESQFVYAYHVLISHSKGLYGQVPFLAFFGPVMNTEMGVVITCT